MPVEYVLSPRHLTALRTRADAEGLMVQNPVRQMLSFVNFFSSGTLFYMPPGPDHDAEFLRVARAAGFEPPQTAGVNYGPVTERLGKSVAKRG